MIKAHHLALLAEPGKGLLFQDRIVILKIVKESGFKHHEASVYDLLDNVFAVQRQMEAVHKTQQEQFPTSEILEKSYQVVSGHLETLLDSMSMWIADMEDLTQEPSQEPENEGFPGM